MMGGKKWTLQLSLLLSGYGGGWRIKRGCHHKLKNYARRMICSQNISSNMCYAVYLQRPCAHCGQLTASIVQQKCNVTVNKIH